MKSLGLSQEDKWRRIINRQPTNLGLPGKMVIKTQCHGGCVCDRLHESCFCVVCTHIPTRTTCIQDAGQDTMGRKWHFMTLWSWSCRSKITVIANWAKVKLCGKSVGPGLTGCEIWVWTVDTDLTRLTINVTSKVQLIRQLVCAPDPILTCYNLVAISLLSRNQNWCFDTVLDLCLSDICRCQHKGAKYGVLCAKFGSPSLIRFWVNVRTHTHTRH